MILNVRLVGALFALMLIAACVCVGMGNIMLALVPIFGLGLLSSHMKRNKKYYEAELDEIYGDDDILN